MYNEIEKRLNDVGVDIMFFPYTDGTSSTLLNEVLHEKINEKKNAKDLPL